MTGEAGTLRRLLEEIGAPSAQPILDKRVCCPQHLEWSVTFVGLELAPGWEDDEAMWALLRRVGTGVARGGWWLGRATGPDGAVVEARADPAAGHHRWSVSAPGDAPPPRFESLRRFGEHALLGVAWHPDSASGREDAQAETERRVVDELVARAVAGKRLSEKRVARALAFRGPRALRLALGDVSWATVLRRAAERLSLPDGEPGADPPPERKGTKKGTLMRRAKHRLLEALEAAAHRP